MLQLIAAFLATVFVQVTRVVQFVMFIRVSFKREQAKKHGFIRLCALVLYCMIGGLMTVLYAISGGTSPVDNENSDMSEGS